MMLKDWALANEHASDITWAGAEDDAHLASGAFGYFNPADKKIVISSDVSLNHQLAILVHELVHAIGINSRDGRPDLRRG
jgi:Zn-dependent peptidase ImmA (M78 family)